MTAPLARPIGSALVAVATIVVIVAAAVIVFFNPVYVGFEQARTGADRWTGYAMADVHTVTDQVLTELYVGPATFAMDVQGVPVFDPKERAHLADVRTVFVGLGAAAVVAVLGLLLASRVRRREWVWRGVAWGSAVLAGAVVVLGVFFGLFFDLAFDVFHRIFFGAGTYTFDPRVERLVQLFPEDFWFETSIALAVLLLVASVAVAMLARRRRRSARP